MNDAQYSNTPLLGRYQTLSELAKSPIGGLFMALDVPERRIVALRSLPAEAKLAADDRVRLLDAGRWVKGLDDPAIMMPLEIGVQEGFVHSAYKYDVSEPLRGVLRLATFKGNPMPPALALRIAHDTVLAARAIEACGAAPSLGESLCGGLIPDSVLIGQDGRTRVCDAGVATVLRRTREYGQHAELLSYAAPEQVEGGGHADSRSDVFTIGVFLWEMLANRRLFFAQDTGEVIDKLRNFDVPALDSLQRGTAEPIPEMVVQLVKRALEREPTHRYAGTTAMLQALETHASSLMAAPSDVGAYVSGLVENIFETRLRAIERARGPGEDELEPQRSANSPKPAVAAAKGLELRARAATAKGPKSSPTNVAPIPPAPPRAPRTGTTPRPAVSPVAPVPPPTPLPTTRRPSMKSNPPVIAALVDDAIAQGAREAGTGSVHPTIPPPVTSLQSVIPAVPRVFELPGAELFATPGLPSVKPAPVDVRVDQPATVDQPQPRAGGEAEGAAAPREGSSAQAPVGEHEPKSLETELEGEQEPPLPPKRHLKRPGAGVAVLSVVIIAFIVGTGMRHCSDRKVGATSTRAESATAALAVDAGAAVTLTTLNNTATSATASTLDAGQPRDVMAQGLADAGPAAPAPPPPKKVQSPVRHRKSTPAPRSTSAPHYNSKVTRGSGKTTR